MILQSLRVKLTDKLGPLKTLPDVKLCVWKQQNFVLYIPIPTANQRKNLIALEQTRAKLFDKKVTASMANLYWNASEKCPL